MKNVKMSYETSYYHETDKIFAHHHMVWGNYPGSRKPYTHGHAFWNYPSGKRSAEGQFIGGVRSGIWRWFNEDGSLQKVTDFGKAEYIKQPAPKDFDLSICTPDNTILLDEEDGYICWLWIPCWSIEETVNWWKYLDGVCQFVTGCFLPGIKIKDYPYELWQSLHDSGRCYTGHLNEDDDSFLATPSGERIYHKNYDLAQTTSRAGQEKAEITTIEGLLECGEHEL